MSGFEQVKCRNDLHNNSCHVAVSSELADRITIMAVTGRWYLLGPPVQHAQDVKYVASHVISQITPNGIVDHTAEGPVPYDSSWVAGGRKLLRKGMQAVDLWTGTVRWEEYHPARAFTFVVMDHMFLSEIEAKKAKKAKKANSGTGHHCPKPPRFETFVLIVLPGPEQRWCDDEIQGVDYVYEWRTSPFWPSWENRAA